MQDWFKVSAAYPEDISIVTVDDSAEVMFMRGLAFLRRGKGKTNGFIPDGVLHTLTRHPARAKRIAAQLTREAPDGSAGPWEVVPGGYLVRSWSTHNDAADELEERRRNERARQAKHRSGKKKAPFAKSRDLSRDNSRDVTDPDREREVEAAAAAPATPLPPSLTILRAALEARKLVVRWDRLTPTQAAEIDALIAEHGDAALVACAIRAFQPDRPAAFAQAWLPGWRDLRPAGDLRVIHPPCDQPGHSGTTKHCAQCASEQKAAR